MIFITLAALIFALPMKETYKPIILKQRTKKHGIVAPDSPAQSQKITSVIATRLLRPFHMLYTEASRLQLSNICCHC
jgi:hypothetical protein